MDKKYLNEEIGFEHLHLHTDFSLLDGFGTVEEYAERATKINQKFLCVTDHGMMAAIPRQIRACEENNLNYVVGCELYLQNGHPSDPEVFKSFLPEEKKKIRKSYHLLAIAYNNTGYKNLVQLCTWAWINGFYYKPRINYEQLLKYKEGIFFTSCCYNSEIGQAFDKGGDEAGFQKIEQYIKMFGDNFFLSIMLLDFKKQKLYNEFIIKAHAKYSVPICMEGDCHYCLQEDSKYQRYMLMIQKKTTLKDIEAKLSEEDKEDIFELQDSNLWMKSEKELNQKWLEMYSDTIPHDIFAQAKKNTVIICNRTKGVEIDRNVKLPQIPEADEKLKEDIFAGFRARGLAGQKKYMYRLKEEFDLISSKGLSSYFIIQKQLVNQARDLSIKLFGWGDGREAIGPGRGSAVGSLICYVLGITDVDPIKHDLLFSRFLSESRGGRSIKLRYSESSKC